MVVGHEEVAVIFFLHLHKVAQSAEIVAQMEIASRTYAAAYNVFFHIQNILGLQNYDYFLMWDCFVSNYCRKFAILFIC